MICRLSSIAPDLVQQLERQSPQHLRSAAINAANLAVEHTQLADPRLDRALAALRDGTFGDLSELNRVQQLTDELDEAAWDIQEMAETGAASRQDYSVAFRRARAAASVGCAMDADALTSALESIYEAQAAVADLAAVWRVFADSLEE